jgi:hypothetical protein
MRCGSRHFLCIDADIGVFRSISLDPEGSKAFRRAAIHRSQGFVLVLFEAKR